MVKRKVSLKLALYQNKNVKQARRQLVEKHYADRYATDPRQVVRIAATFSDELKNIGEWEVV